MDLLTQYKKSVALITAVELGLFKLLVDRPLTTSELAGKLSSNAEMLEIFLCYLEQIEILKKENDYWGISEFFQSYFISLDKYASILDHEKNLYQNWITPYSIIEAMKKGSGERCFDKQGWDLDQKKTYVGAMYGQNINILSFWLIRELSIMKNIKLLEFGRSPGVIAKALSQKFPGLTGKIVICNEFYDICIENISSTLFKVSKINEFDFVGKFDIICLLNTVHYFTRNQMIEFTRRLKLLMNDNAIIFIVDFFPKKVNPFLSGLLLDWITHGGIYNIQTTDIDNIIEEAGLKKIKQKFISEIGLDLFFIKAN